ncbi:cytochrome P450 [Lasiosphaeria miniovina]|uniref:Cytochrome P450 n=1 Tax=Lasiosphaeria miniovina TaxID=1954250 RepID=A0AA39ZYZ4_9PEZI|nr:cytochrome P450 [Lasiosphaeria miniovina]KAK0706155.1 cytochrome P450 [Lasiosphaeria miniovina]
MEHSWVLGHLEIVGKLLQDMPSDAHGNYLPMLILENWRTLFPNCTQRPPVVYLDMWPFAQPLLLPMTLPVAVQVTQERSLTKAREQKDILYPLTRNRDLSSMEGAEWRLWRKRLNPGFSIQTITGRIPDLMDEVEKFYAALESHAGPNWTWGAVFPLEAETIKLALSIIFRFFFGPRVQARLAGRQAELENAVVDSVKRMVFFIHIGNFLSYWGPWRRFKLWRNYRTMMSGFGPVLERRLTELTRQGGDEKRTDTLVDAIVEGFQADRENGEPNTSDDDFIELAVGQIGTFIFAGHDTTASAICWVLHLLTQHPDVLARMRAEHDAVLGPDPAQAAAAIRADPHLINTLTYTNAVIKETTRVNPNVGTMRRGEPGYFIAGPQGSGYEGMQFPTYGFVVWSNPFSYHRDPELWPRVHEFLPERFLVADNDPLHPQKDAWRFFEMGPRNCIGQYLALTEIKLALAVIVRQLDIECAWDEWDRKTGNKKARSVWQDRAYHVGTDSPPHVKDGMPVHIRRRQPKQ